jgi:hypothetical protein
VLTVLAVLALGAGVARATTFLDSGFGTPHGGVTARSLAMGSTGISLHQGSDALFFNPAVLVPSASKLEVDLSGNMVHASEDRLVPLYDSFLSYVDDAIVALNRNVYGSVQGGAVYRLPNEHPMAIGIGVFERYDFNYDYFEEARDPDSQSQPRDRIIEERTIGTDGSLWSVSVGYGAEIASHVQLGLSGHRYFGTPKRSIRVQNYDTGTLTSDTVEQSLGGWGWTVGAWGRPSERIDVGVSFEGPFKVDGDFKRVQETASGAVDTVTTTALNRTIDYPGTLRFGFTYHPRNLLRAIFAVELERRYWESLDTPVVGVFGDSLNLRDTWDLRVGIEHVFYNDLPLRFGFRYLENYADTESARSIYSVGLGYRFGRLGLDVTGLYARQTSRQPFLFDPSYGAFPAPASDERVEDSVTGVVVAARYSL